MKTLNQEAGKPSERKLSTQKNNAKTAAFYRNHTFSKDWMATPTPKPFTRSDGSVGVDKTAGAHSRPLSKETIRNANRAIQKRGRQLLKRAMLKQAFDEYMK
jgi:hypothetical protein